MNDRAMSQLSGLAGRLVADNLISAQQAEEAQKQAALEQMQFVQYLIEKMNVDGPRLAEMASQEFGVPLFDIKAFNRSAIPDGLVEVDLVTKHHALPLFRRGNVELSLDMKARIQGLRKCEFATTLARVLQSIKCDHMWVSTKVGWGPSILTLMREKEVPGLLISCTLLISASRKK